VLISILTCSEIIHNFLLLYALYAVILFLRIVLSFQHWYRKINSKDVFSHYGTVVSRPLGQVGPLPDL